mmetsp:Transcript_29568/g.40613  ORF Transcript_29568/g.40613 Transcript_29568/m.40613 type:complete len:484 (-) Transcript_29568:195-1646(-)
MSTIIYWTPVLAVSGLGFLFSIPQFNKSNNFLLHKKLRYYFPRQWIHNIEYVAKDFTDLSLGEFIMSTFFVAILLVHFFLQYSYFLSHVPYDGALRAPIFRALGSVNFVTMAFLPLPVSRHSIWLPIMGISFERAIKFHRAWAVLTILIMATHGFGIWISYATSPMNSPDSEFKYVLKFQKNPVTNWSNISGFISFCFAFMMALTALPIIRRNLFEIFYNIHLLCAPLCYLFAGFHMPVLLQWLLPALILYGIDWFFRLRNLYFKPITMITEARIIEMPSNKGEITAITKLSVSSKRGSHSYQPGQYFFITIPLLTSLQSHPISTSLPLESSSMDPDCDIISFHIRDMGEHTWTHALAEAVRTGQLQQPYPNPNLTVQLDGPFGHPFVPLQLYSTLLLCCGGIGITPCVCSLASIVHAKEHANNKEEGMDLWGHLQRVVFVWTTREEALIEEFRDILQKASNLFGTKNVQIYLSSVNRSEEVL